MTYHKYTKGDIVGLYGNAFNHQGKSMSGAVIIDWVGDEYEIEHDHFFYWRTPEELHQWLCDHMTDVVSSLDSL